MALATWLISKGAVSTADWDRAVRRIAGDGTTAEGVLRMFQCCCYASEDDDPAEPRVSILRSAMIRCPSFENVGLIVGPRACVRISQIETALLTARISIEEGPQRLDGGPILAPPVLCLAFADAVALDLAARELRLDVKDVEVRPLSVDEFTHRLTAADGSYLKLDAAEAWNPVDGLWRPIQTSIGERDGRMGVFRARLNGNSVSRTYMRCPCTSSLPRRLTSKDAVLWGLWHATSCVGGASTLLSLDDVQSAWVGIRTRIPLPIELARAAFASAAALPTMSSTQPGQLAAESWPAVQAQVARGIASSVGLAVAREGHPGWPSGSRPPDHLRF